MPHGAVFNDKKWGNSNMNEYGIKLIQIADKIHKLGNSSRIIIVKENNSIKSQFSLFAYRKWMYRIS